MKIRQLGHVCFSTNDIEKTLKFYVEILCLEIAHKFINEKGELYGIFIHSGGSTFIEFFKSDILEKEDEKFRHFCLVVDSIQSAREVLKKHKIEFEITKGRTDGVPQGWILDPNGIKIEFHEYDEGSKLLRPHR